MHEGSRRTRCWWLARHLGVGMLLFLLVQAIAVAVARDRMRPFAARVRSDAVVVVEPDDADSSNTAYVVSWIPTTMVSDRAAKAKLDHDLDTIVTRARRRLNATAQPYATRLVLAVATAGERPYEPMGAYGKLRTAGWPFTMAVYGTSCPQSELSNGASMRGCVVVWWVRRDQVEKFYAFDTLYCVLDAVMVLAGVLFISAMFDALRQRSRRRRGECCRCGYPKSGRAVCPECGSGSPGS